MADKIESDSDSEYEETETKILLELKGVIDSDFINQTPFEKFKIIGIDKNNPILQLNNYHFLGEYEETLGTSIFLEEDDKYYEQCDPIFSRSPPNRLKYSCHSFKVLNMKRVFISDKKGDEEKEEEKEISVQQENEKTISDEEDESFQTEQ